jgi:amidase
MVTMAHGNDGGGSIRIPASCCGLFGLKPTRGRNPLGPSVGDVMHGLVVEHALTLSVRDSAALLDATLGMDVGAPYDAPPRAVPYAQEVNAPPGCLRVAFSTKTFASTPVHADCVAAVHDAASLLADLGHTVFERDLAVADPQRLNDGFVTLWTGGTAASLDDWARTLGRPPTPDAVEAMTWALYELGRAIPLSRYLLAVADLQRASREIQRQFADVDVWLTPTLAEPPVALGTLAPQPGNPLAGFYRAMAYCPFTPVWNITGQPAMSLPLYWNAADIPIGVHVAGRFGDEATLFRLAGQIESARPWSRRVPPAVAGLC